MIKKIAAAGILCLTICLYLSGQAHSAACISVDEILNMKFSCVQYQGKGYGFTLNFYKNPDAPSDLYWKMDMATVVNADNLLENCINIGDNLKIDVSCAEYAGLQFSFALNFYPNPKDNANLYWGMDNNSLEVKTNAFALSSSAFSNNQTIPSKYSCDGTNISPPLSWANAPSKAKSFVLVMDDPDAVAVAGKVWDHWIMYDIPGTLAALAENAVLPVGAKLGKNSFDNNSYGGPCPPNGTHRYYFRLYALSVASLGLDSGASRAQVEAAMQNFKLGEPAIFMGKYPQ